MPFSAATNELVMNKGKSDVNNTPLEKMNETLSSVNFRATISR